MSDTIGEDVVRKVLTALTASEYKLIDDMASPDCEDWDTVTPDGWQWQVVVKAVMREL